MHSIISSASTLVIVFILIRIVMAQPPVGGPVVAGAAALPPPPPPPPGRGFQLKCSDVFALADESNPELLREFADNSPPGYEIVTVDPTIHPGKNAHRYLVKYRSQHFRKCEDIRRVYHNMSTYKPQNCNVGTIAVVPGGYMVEYKQFCQCYRRSYRRRRHSSWLNLFLDRNVTPPRTGPYGSTIRCDDRDFTCGYQSF